MIKTIILSMCLAASSLSLNARAQDERQYTDGPVTEVDYIHVEYGHFEEYIDWLNSTWKPTMEATKKAGLIIDYKVFKATPRSPDQPFHPHKNGEEPQDQLSTCSVHAPMARADPRELSLWLER